MDTQEVVVDTTKLAGQMKTVFETVEAETKIPVKTFDSLVSSVIEFSTDKERLLRSQYKFRGITGQIRLSVNISMEDVSTDGNRISMTPAVKMLEVVSWGENDHYGRGRNYLTLKAKEALGIKIGE